MKSALGVALLLAACQDNIATPFPEGLEPFEDNLVAPEPDGPFVETKEWIAGYDLLSASDLDEAIEYASRHPMAKGGRVEVRPVWPFEEGE